VSKKILVIDNYDSFVYILVQYLGELGATPHVVRNDKYNLKQLEEFNPDGLLISPGPGTPSKAGISSKAIKHFEGKLPIFGVCLGHQCIGEVYGANVLRADELMHGKTSSITHKNTGVFASLKNPITATRYHSLVIEEASIPEELEITARSETGTIMGVRHKEYDTEGVQFHPESILTEDGHTLVKTFVKRC